MEQAWVRPYEPGIGRWWVLGWEAFSFVALGWTTVDLYRLDGHAISLTIAALLVVWVLGAWRITRMGVYLSVGDVRGGGVRIRGLLRTRTLLWDDVARVWLHSSTHRIGPFTIPNGMTVLIERWDGAVVNTELWAKGVDFHARPGDFRAVYQALRDRHLAAADPGPLPAA